MSIRKLTTGGLTTISLAATILTLAATPALARLGFKYERQITGESTPHPFFRGSAGSIAIDHKNRYLFVFTSNETLGTTEQIEVLTTTGEYVTTLTGAETPAHSFGGFSDSIAVDENTGQIYIADSSDDVVDVIQLEEESQAGKTVVREAYLRQFKRASWQRPEQVMVDPASGDVYVIAKQDGEVQGEYKEQLVVDVFDSSGAYRSEITEADLPGPSTKFAKFELNMAVDDKTGELFVTGSESVYIFSKAGEYLTTWTGAHTPAPYFSFTPVYDSGSLQIAADTAGNIFLGVEGQGVIDVFDPTNLQEETFKGQITGTPSGHFPLARGSEGRIDELAVDQTSGEVYVVDRVAERQDVIDVFSPPFPLPTAIAGLPSAVGATGATLTGTVNPEGRPVTSCEFEYGLSMAYGQETACSPENVGGGLNTVPVSASLAGVLPGSEYHYRVTAGNIGGAESSVDQRFVTAPSVGDESVSGVSQFTAVLHGSVEPGVVPTTYHFVYGASPAYDSVAPVPDVGFPLVRGEHTVSQLVTGLTAGTTYHYAIVASSAAGTFTGPDETFTTPSIPPPFVGVGGASGVTAGEAVLSGTIDPKGWASTYRFEYGTSSGYGSRWPTVDASLGGLIGAQPVSVAVQNLLPGTTYHFRLVASNGGGTAYGPDLVFTTGIYPPSIVQSVPVLDTFVLPSPGQSVKHKAKPKAKHKLTKHRKAKRKKGKSSGRGGRKRRA